MTQNHELDMDCVADSKAKKNINEIIEQPIIDDIIIKLLNLSKTLFNSDTKYLYIQQIITSLANLEKNFLTINAFIVIELIKSTKKMLLKLHALKLKLDNNTIKVIDKCINNLPDLIKQHYNNELELNDEVLWCMEAADSITEGNNCFFTEIFYLDNFTSRILFGKEVDINDTVINNNNEISSLINKSNVHDLENTNLNKHHLDKDSYCGITVELPSETDFLQEALNLAKNLNSLFIDGIKRNILINYSSNIINCFNQIKYVSTTLHYNKIAFSCYFIAKIYNCITLFNLNITDKHIIAILAKLHSYFIKQIESYLDLNPANTQQQLESKIKSSYHDFMTITNLSNDHSIASNEDYYNIINNSNFSSLINKNNSATQNNYNLIDNHFNNIGLCLTHIKNLHNIANNLSQIKVNLDNNHLNNYIKEIKNCCEQLTSNINKVFDKKTPTQQQNILNNNTENQEYTNKIYSFIATNHLQTQLDKLIQNQDNQKTNLKVDIKSVHIYSHTYIKITSLIKNLIDNNIYSELLKNSVINQKNNDISINFELNIDTIGINTVVTLKNNKCIFNDEKFFPLAVKYNIIGNNDIIEKHNRLKIILAVQEKSPQANNNSIINLYSNIRKIGGDLIINATDTYSEFILSIPNIHVRYNMMLIKINNVICAISSDMIKQVIEPSANNKNLISLHKMFDSKNNTNIAKCYILIIEYNNKKLKLAVDSILGFEQLFIENLPAPFAATEGIDGIARINKNNIALIINPFDYHI